MDRTTLQTLIELATTKCNSAAARLANQQRLVEQARSHLKTLRQYTQEYDARAGCRVGECRDPSAQFNQEIFLERLRHAVDTQLRELEIRESAAKAAAEDLALARQRRKSLETLAERLDDQEQRKQARREQKSMDEFAQRARAAHMIVEGSES